MIDYLLERVSEGDRRDFEGAYFEDDDLFEELADIEYEIINAYIADKLPGAVRRDFELKYLNNPDRKQRVEVAKAAYKPAEESDRSPRCRKRGRFLPQYVWKPVAASAVLAGVVGAFLGLRHRTQEKLAINHELTVNTDSRLSHDDEQSALSPLHTLVPGLTRGTRYRNLVDRSPKATQVLLQVMPANHSSKYGAVVESAEGSVVWKMNGIHQATEGSPIVLELPADVLPPGDYVLTVKGLEAIEVYTFRVTLADRAP
jgi:hypothetical protein